MPFTMNTTNTTNNLAVPHHPVLPPRPAAGSIPTLKVFVPETVMLPLREVLLSGYLSEGTKVREFEDRLADWLGTPNVLALNSGTSALQLAVRLAGVGPGDEVISTPLTCIATNEPIVLAGARIRWADIDPQTGNLDPADIQRKITDRTRAIMVMHWGGNPCDMAEIRALADAHGLIVIEDACHALGAQYQDRMIGVHSDFVCFSFQAVKIMTTGDGGALVCRRPQDLERGRKLRWYGMTRRLDTSMEAQRAFFAQDVDDIGYKIHMNDLTASIGLEQLKYVRENIRLHQAHGARYNQAFAGLRRVRPLRQDADRRPNGWLYTLLVDDPSAFSRTLKAAGIDTSPIHVRNDRYTIFKDCAGAESLPGVDLFDAQHVCIPVGWWLHDSDVEHIIQAVLQYDAEA